METTAAAYKPPEAAITYDTAIVYDYQARYKNFSMEGRIGVMTSMARALLWAVVGGVFLLLVGAVAGPGAVMFSVLALLPVLALDFCLYAKRLHDLNMSAWFMLVFIIPVVGAIFMLYVAFMPGSKDANNYGITTETLGWEKVLGLIGIAGTVLSVLALIFSAMAS